MSHQVDVVLKLLKLTSGHLNHLSVAFFLFECFLDLLSDINFGLKRDNSIISRHHDKPFMSLELILKLLMETRQLLLFLVNIFVVTHNEFELDINHRSDSIDQLVGLSVAEVPFELKINQVQSLELVLVVIELRMIWIQWLVHQAGVF